MSVKRKNGYLLRELGNSYVIVPIAGNQLKFHDMLSLNETGAFLWEQLREEKTEEELLEAVLLDYQVEEETARKDIREFIDQAVKAGILQ